MTDDLENGDLSSPVTNGAAGDSASALPASNGPTETGAGGDEKELSTAVKRFVTGVDDKELSTAPKRFLIAVINRLVEENRQLKRFKEKHHDVDQKGAFAD